MVILFPDKKSQSLIKKKRLSETGFDVLYLLCLCVKNLQLQQKQKMSDSTNQPANKKARLVRNRIVSAETASDRHATTL